MKALDTNIIVRFLVKDDTDQADQVYELFKRAEATKEVFYIPLLVVLETIWVLDAVYRIVRSEIIDALHDLFYLSILKFEAQGAVKRFLEISQTSGVDLSDILIASSAKLSGCDTILTFDKKAAKLRDFELMA